MRPEPLARYFRIDGCPALKVAVGQLILGSCGIRRRRLRLKERRWVFNARFTWVGIVFTALFSVSCRFTVVTTIVAQLSRSKERTTMTPFGGSELSRAIDKRSRRMIFRSVTMQLNLVSCVDYSVTSWRLKKSYIIATSIPWLGFEFTVKFCVCVSQFKKISLWLHQKKIHPPHQPSRKDTEGGF